jgi:threonine/homoserine/homoserine lactone efflux protein
MFNFLAFITYACIVSFTPGPNNIMVLAYATKNGHRKTLPFRLGVSTGFFMILVLSIFFNQMLVQFLPKAQLIMRIIGTTFMLYLAFKFSGIQLPSKSKKKSKKTEQTIPLTYRTGILLQFINPKGLLVGLTIISTFIAPYFPTYTMQILFSILLSLIALAATTSWAIFGTMFNRFITQYERPFNLAMSLLLVYSALSISGIFH